jgi:hypothetical protein
MRDELRLESALGYDWLFPYASILAAAEPYVVLDPGKPQQCSGCEFVPFRQSFGVVLVLRLALFVPFARREAAGSR